MIIFVFGDDTFRVKERVHQLKHAFKEKHDPTGMNTSEYLGKLEIGQVLQDACSFPFMGGKRMVIVRGLIETATAGEHDVWVEGFGRVPESTVVVLWETMEPKKLAKNGLYKKIAKGADVHEYPFPQLEEAALTKWIDQRVKMRGGSGDRAAVNELVARVGADLWQLDNEIQKLIAFSGGAITKEMVENQVRASFEGEIFALMDAVSQKRSADALRRLREERWSGANDFQLFTMLARQVRILLGVRSMIDANPQVHKQEVADELGVHPFVAQKSIAQARSFTLDELKRAHEALCDMDLKMKTGGVDAELAVDLVTTDLLK